MAKNVLDFETKKEAQLHKRKEAKVDALRNAFCKARGDEPSKPPRPRAEKGRKPKKK
jgi:predicted HicB family RNase H-like nuclease